jgi:hypothetical protein
LPNQRGKVYDIFAQVSKGRADAFKAIHMLLMATGFTEKELIASIMNTRV